MECENEAEDNAEPKSLRKRRSWREGSNRYCLKKGDISVILVLLGIASFCLGYYFTRDWHYLILPIK